MGVASGLFCPVNGVVPELPEFNGLPMQPGKPSWKMPVVLGGWDYHVYTVGFVVWVIEPNVGFVVWVIEPRIVLPPSLVLVPRLRDAHAQDSSQNTP